MCTIEKITIEVQKLSEIERGKVLKFIEGLEEDKDWKRFSLDKAMSGLENDKMALYTEVDCLEFWNNDIDDKIWNNAE
jgi:hypothetical protein